MIRSIFVSCKSLIAAATAPISSECSGTVPNLSGIYLKALSFLASKAAWILVMFQEMDGRATSKSNPDLQM